MKRIKRTKKVKDQQGFTLIETMIAMGIFTFAIIALFGMQRAAITQNTVANGITTGSTWATDRVEELIVLNYTDPLLVVTRPCADFDDPDWWRTSVNPPIPGSSLPVYTVYWDVANDCTLIEDTVGGETVGLPNTSEYRPKHVYVAVTKQNLAGEEELMSSFYYIKQN